jgi:peptidoglycan hydrolase-like protein with peptidoglycan-binding domain
MTRRSRVVAGIAVAAIAGGAALSVTVALAGEDGDAARRTATGPTATVQRRDLIVREDVDGTLGYADPRSTTAPAAGTVTAVPQAGSVLQPGAVLYRLDGKPVVVLNGAQAAWRRLAEGVNDAVDVRQLEANLVALGYDRGRTIRVDRRFTVATRAAVERLQRALGLDPTGALELGQVVSLDGARRVSEVTAAAGVAVPAGSEVLKTTATRRVVTVKLDTSRQAYVRVRQRVEVELPGGDLVDGTVTEVGTVATAETNPDGSSGTPTVDVTISLHGKGAGLDQAPVTVKIASEIRRGVLAVPVTALVAVAGGGSALEAVQADGTTELVRVEVGTFADGFVEVRGRAVRAGLRVVEAPA